MPDKQSELLFIQKRLKQLRKNCNNVTAKEVSLSIGWDETALSKIENGTNFPLFGTLITICNYFNISLGEFFAPMLQHKNSNLAKAYSLVEQLPKDMLETIINVMEFMSNKK